MNQFKGAGPLKGLSSEAKGCNGVFNEVFMQCARWTLVPKDLAVLEHRLSLSKSGLNGNPRLNHMIDTGDFIGKPISMVTGQYDVKEKDH